MEIPSKFSLVAHQWVVHHVDGMIVAADGDTCRGLCEYDKLALSVNTAQVGTMVLHTFFHEFLHAALWSLGHPLADDEKFVDALAGTFAQMMDSAEFT